MIKIFRSKIGILALIVFLILQSIPWCWKTSGILEQSKLWLCYPWGYAYFLPDYWNWYIGKENLLYIWQNLAFLGTPDVYVAQGSGFEIHRSLYSLLVSSVWFLGPIFGAIFVNLIFWLLAIWGACQSIRVLTDSKFAQYVTIWLVVFGQGFIYSVGEISPHTMGYASSFILLGLASYYKIWEPQTKFSNQLVVYALLGLLQLGYNSPFLSLFFLVPLTLRSFLLKTQDKKHYILAFKKMILLMLIGILPFQMFSMITHYILEVPGTMGYHLGPWLNYQDFTGVFTRYCLVVLEGFLSYGPWLILFFLLGVYIAIYKKEKCVLFATLILMFQFIFVGLFTMHGGVTGYVTYGLAALFTLISVYGINEIWLKNKTWMKLGLIFTLLACPVYVHSHFYGFHLPGQGFTLGYIRQFSENKYHHYEIEKFI